MKFRSIFSIFKSKRQRTSSDEQPSPVIVDNNQDNMNYNHNLSPINTSTERTEDEYNPPLTYEIDSPSVAGSLDTRDSSLSSETKPSNLENNNLTQDNTLKKSKKRKNPFKYVMKKLFSKKKSSLEINLDDYPSSTSGSPVQLPPSPTPSVYNSPVQPVRFLIFPLFLQLFYSYFWLL